RLAFAGGARAFGRCTFHRLVWLTRGFAKRRNVDVQRRIRFVLAFLFMVLPPRLVLSASRLPPWTVTPIRQPPLAGRFTLRRVRHRVVVVAAGGFVGPTPSLLDGFFRRVGPNQAVTPVPNQVPPPSLDERLADREVVLRLEELHQRSLQL